MAEPVAIGMVLASLADREGRAIERSAVKGQLYVSGAEVVVVRPTSAEAWLHRGALCALFGSVALVLANVVAWQRTEVLVVAAGLQVAYWLSLGPRRRAMAPRPLDTAALEAARRQGRAAISIPASAVKDLVPPEPPRAGFRKPARLVLAEGALEIYLDVASFEQVRRALGRA
jgi:hypothetical protein